MGERAAQLEQGDVTFAHLWRALAKGRWLLLACVLIGALLAGLVAFTQKPVYRIEALLAPVKADSSEGAAGMLGNLTGGLAGVIGALGGATTDIEESMALLRSKSLLEEFIRDENLLPVLFADRWDAKQSAWKESAPEDVPTLNDGVDEFDEDIRAIRIDAKTGLVTFAIEWTDRLQAVAWSNALIQRVNAAARSRAIHEASKSIEFLNQELEKTSVSEVRMAIYRLMESRVNSVMLANVRDEFAFRVIEPARVPDSDKYVRPKKAMLITAGGFLGLVMGCFILLMAAQLSTARSVGSDRR